MTDMSNINDTLNNALHKGTIPGLVGTGVNTKRNRVDVYVNDFSLQDTIEKYVDSNKITFVKLVKVVDQVIVLQDVKTVFCNNEGVK